MKPCSAYCEPAKGVHVHTEAVAHTDLDQARAFWVGKLQYAYNDGYTCYPAGTTTQVLAVDPAPESIDPTPDPRFPGWFLWTVQVLA